jgi:hypothetical protein
VLKSFKEGGTVVVTYNGFDEDDEVPFQYLSALSKPVSELLKAQESLIIAMESGLDEASSDIETPNKAEEIFDVDDMPVFENGAGPFSVPLTEEVERLQKAAGRALQSTFAKGFAIDAIVDDRFSGASEELRAKLRRRRSTMSDSGTITNALAAATAAALEEEAFELEALEARRAALEVEMDVCLEAHDLENETVQATAARVWEEMEMVDTAIAKYIAQLHPERPVSEELINLERIDANDNKISDDDDDGVSVFFFSSISLYYSSIYVSALLSRHLLAGGYRG